MVSTTQPVILGPYECLADCIEGDATPTPLLANELSVHEVPVGDTTLSRSKFILGRVTAPRLT